MGNASNKHTALPRKQELRGGVDILETQEKEPVEIYTEEIPF